MNDIPLLHVLYGCISCLFSFMGVAVAEQCWQPFPSPLVTVLLAVCDDRVVTDVPSSCSDDLKRSVRTKLTLMAFTMSRHISQTFWLFFSLYFYFAFCFQHCKCLPKWPTCQVTKMIHATFFWIAITSTTVGQRYRPNHLFPQGFYGSVTTVQGGNSHYSPPVTSTVVAWQENI